MMSEPGPVASLAISKLGSVKASPDLGSLYIVYGTNNVWRKCMRVSKEWLLLLKLNVYIFHHHWELFSKVILDSERYEKFDSFSKIFVRVSCLRIFYIDKVINNIWSALRVEPKRLNTNKIVFTETDNTRFIYFWFYFF